MVIKAILDEFPLTKTEALSLPWTPRPSLQEYLIQHLSEKSNVVNGAEFEYGNSKRKGRIDGDFESGETDITIYM